MRPSRVPVVLLLAAASLADAASTVRLPASACPSSDSIFWSGFEIDATPHDPSNGSGGSFPGNVTRIVNVSGVGPRSYYLYLPPTYSPTRAWPVLLALHGATGSAATAPTAAQQVRTDWSAVADSAGLIVLAPVASGGSGGWIPDTDIPAMLAAIDDTAAAYNVERSRIVAWGFSAGGHVAHGLALTHASVFASYGVSAGVLRAFACSVPGDPGSPDCATFLPTVSPKIPVDIHVGTSDSLYPEAQADVPRFTGAGWIQERTLFFRPVAGGHVYTPAHLNQIWNNLCPFALGP
jgi:poly(3-hydroxybutyrate) depolymerase